MSDQGPGRGSPGSRRRIREAVVQYLYAAASGDGLPPSDDAAVLALLLEPLREKAVHARATSLLHLQQGRDQAAGPLADLVAGLLKVDVTDDESGLLKALRDLRDAEASVASELGHVRHELHGNKSAGRLAEFLEDARQANIRSRAAAARLSTCEPVFPALDKIRKDALACWTELAVHADRLEAALARQPGPQPELRKVVKAEAEVERVAGRIREYLDGLRAHLGEIDRLLASVIDNYTPDRLDRVDRAILRLAAYELLHDPAIPPGVAIDEAIELARAFGTTDSPRFVNGILDKLPRQSPQ